MSNRYETAVELRAHGYNCAQAVIAAVADQLGINEEQAFGFAGAFGGGLHVGEVCGAATGAAMAIGLRYGQLYPDDVAAKAQCGAVIGQFMDEFRRREGAVCCRDLLGYNPRNPEEKAKYGERNKTVCPKAIETALKILEEMGI